MTTPNENQDDYDENTGIGITLSKPNENQAGEKQAHSKEPWSVCELEGKENYIFDAEHFLIVRVDEGPCDSENAARIVAVINGCKEVPNTWFDVSSSSTPVKDLIEENRLLGEQLESLRAEVARLTEACNKEFASVEKLNAENQKLQKEKENNWNITKDLTGYVFDAFSDPHKPNERYHQIIERVKSELATLRQEKEKAVYHCEKLKEFAKDKHKRDCIKVTLCGDEPLRCTCGLDELLKSGSEERDQYKAAWEKLWQYAEHGGHCRAGTPWMGPPLECTCGLDELRAILDKNNSP